MKSYKKNNLNLQTKRVEFYEYFTIKLYLHINQSKY